MKCPECVKEDKKSRVYIGVSYINAVYVPKWYDENGRLCSGPPAQSTTEYSCSNGHKWSETT